jgi:hypothetical protein
VKAVFWMVVASAGSVLVVAALVNAAARLPLVMGMAAPLAAATISWVLAERTYRQHPERLTRVMVSGFAAKMVFFGTYVAVMIKELHLEVVPFVASFTGYFIGLYLIEAVLLRRLVAGG